MFWQQGRHKRIQFSIHFDANSYEFKQCPISPKYSPLPHHTMTFITSVSFLARSPPKEHRVPSHEIQIDKGNVEEKV
jgi:hypothetical protein